MFYPQSVGGECRYMSMLSPRDLEDTNGRQGTRIGLQGEDVVMSCYTQRTLKLG